mmetsp:Transcript_25130/g.79292  ORF Transcript_25130/g.79292 Transcript_25130/m.79292 type:complete len:304 (+) Transcript_25130:2-913(+)
MHVRARVRVHVRARVRMAASREGGGEARLVSQLFRPVLRDQGLALQVSAPTKHLVVVRCLAARMVDAGNQAAKRSRRRACLAVAVETPADDSAVVLPQAAGVVTPGHNKGKALVARRIRLTVVAVAPTDARPGSLPHAAGVVLPGRNAGEALALGRFGLRGRPPAHGDAVPVDSAGLGGARGDRREADLPVLAWHHCLPKRVVAPAVCSAIGSSEATRMPIATGQCPEALLLWHVKQGRPGPSPARDPLVAFPEAAGVVRSGRDGLEALVRRGTSDLAMGVPTPTPGSAGGLLHEAHVGGPRG